MWRHGALKRMITFGHPVPVKVRCHFLKPILQYYLPRLNVSFPFLFVLSCYNAGAVH